MFSSIGKHAKDTKFINGTCAHRHTETDTDTNFTCFGSFGIHAIDTNFIFGIPQTYTCTDTQTCTHRQTKTKTLTHRCSYADMHVCIHIPTQHTDVHVGNLKEIVSLNPLLSQN